MILVPVAFSMPTVRIWSSCFDPVPPILILLGPAALTAAMNSVAVLYGFSALTQSTNWSSAIIDTGVMSFQLKGTPVAIGVVNRFDSVMMILLGSPLAPFTSRKPSAPPPGPAGTTNSTGLVGSHAARAGPAAEQAASRAAAARRRAVTGRLALKREKLMRCLLADGRRGCLAP